MRLSTPAILAAALLLPSLLPAQVTATVTSIGQGCPQFGGYVAQLTMGPPVIGQATAVQPAGLPAADGELWISLGAPAQPTVIYPGCFTWLDLSGAVPVTPFMTGTAGAGWINFMIPNDPALVGQQATLQAVMWADWQPTGSLPVVTDALWIMIGDQA